MTSPRAEGLVPIMMKRLESRQDIDYARAKAFVDRAAFSETLYVGRAIHTSGYIFRLPLPLDANIGQRLSTLDQNGMGLPIYQLQQGDRTELFRKVVTLLQDRNGILPYSQGGRTVVYSPIYIPGYGHSGDEIAERERNQLFTLADLLTCMINNLISRDRLLYRHRPDTFYSLKHPEWLSIVSVVPSKQNPEGLIRWIPEVEVRIPGARLILRNNVEPANPPYASYRVPLSSDVIPGFALVVRNKNGTIGFQMRRCRESKRDMDTIPQCILNEVSGAERVYPVGGWGKVVYDRALFPGEELTKRWKPQQLHSSQNQVVQMSFGVLIRNIIEKQRTWHQRLPRLVRDNVTDPVWLQWVSNSSESAIWIVAIRRTRPNDRGDIFWVPEIELRLPVHASS